MVVSCRLAGWTAAELFLVRHLNLRCRLQINKDAEEQIQTSVLDTFVFSSLLIPFPVYLDKVFHPSCQSNPSTMLCVQKEGRRSNYEL